DNTPIREDHIFTAKFVLKSSGNEKIVPKGSTPTAKDLLTNYEELEKAGAKFSFEPVDTSTTGEKTVNVTIHYPSGKTGTVTAKIKVVPIVEEVTDPNEEVPDYYTRVVFDATEDGKLNGTDKTTKVYNVYKGTNWKRAKYEGLSIPSAAYKDGTKSFDKWNTLPEDNFEVKEPLTIKASYADVKTIIPYDPSDPMGRPDDRYVRLTFEGTKGINLSDVKSYYIKKDAGITLGDASIIKPTQKPEIGYAFNGWDKDDTTPINTDIVVKAKAVELEDVIEVKDGVSSPEGYVTVKFISGENGAVVEKSYYVNPNKYVTLTPPTESEINPDTGYEFSAWDRDVTHNQQYKVDTDIKAVFSPTGAISTTPVDDYSKITFEIEGEGGSIVGQNTVYVDPNRSVTLKGPKLDVEVGYYFDSWNPPINQTTFSEDTIIKGRFKAYDDIIPEKTDDGSTNSKPEGYVEVILNNGDDGYIKDGLNTVFYVNPKKNTTLGDILSKFDDTNVIAFTGYKFEGNWDKEASVKIDGSEMTIYVTAEYTPLKNVIPEKDESGNLNKIPKGYVKVVFDTTDKGSIKDSADTIKNVYVNPTVPVKLSDFKPDIDAKTGYEFVGWTEIINYSVLYSGGEVITARYNELENVLTEEKPGYIKVTLESGEGGNFKEGATTTYWVKPNVDVTIPQTEVIENIGKKFKSWDKPLTMNISDGKEVTITATYDDIDPIIPAEGEKPKGYVTVEFITDGNGTLSGTTKYYVNPDANVDLTKNAEGIGLEANVGYEKGTWEGSVTGPFTEGMKIKHVFNKLKDVYTADESTDKPKGYVIVEFTTDGNGTLMGTTKYYVNPNAKVKLGTGVTVPQYTPNPNYVFDAWFEPLDMVNDITGNRKYVATFKTDKVTLTYVADADNPQSVSGDVPAKTLADVNSTIRIANAGNLNKPEANFAGWKIEDKVYQPGEEFTITKNEIAYAQWDATISWISFEFVSSDSTRTLPQEVIDQKPQDIKGKIGEVYTPAYKFNEVKSTDPNDQGEWKFVSWNPENLTVDKDKDNNILTGTWEFVPRGKIKYIFDYEFKNGEDDLPKPDAITVNLVDNIEKYVDETLEMPEYTGEYPDTVDGVPGVWKFAGFTKSSEQAGEVHFIGTWKFIPKDKVLVKYEYKFVDEDGVTEIERPADFTETPPEGKEIYKSQNAEAPTTPVANTEEKTDIATYTFLGWEPAYEQENVQSDVTFAGTWKVVKFDNVKYDAIGGIITKNYGENTTSQEVIDSVELVGYKGDRSAVKFEISDETTIPDGSQAGRFFVRVDITYPDGTIDKAYVRILVRDPIKPHEPEPSYPDEPHYPDEPYYPDEPHYPWRPTWDEPTQGIFDPVVATVPKVEPKRLERHEEYISGYPDGTVRPEGEITRAEVTVIFARLTQKNTFAVFEDKFSDVKPGDWFTESIMKLTSKGIINGYPDGTFKPHNSITRAEFASIASKYITDKKLATENFVDVPLNHWARDVISQVKAQGWITGYLDGTFKPDAPITRAEAVSIVNRMFNRHADRNFINENSFELKKFKDLDFSHWAFYEIYEATNTHDFERIADDLERWEK
ncbi:MAG: S-layer homology domain-containing protein, partial [Ezakiella sp.]|nr:S-layer homology domain-containing protein [Ezakiella sp.]